MGLGSPAHLEAIRSRGSLISATYDGCCTVDSELFNQIYSLHKTMTAQELQMLRRAYGRAGRNFDEMVAQHQEELSTSSLRFDGFRQNGIVHRTIHWEHRDNDMSRLRFLTHIVDVLDTLTEEEWKLVVHSEENLSIRRLLTHEGIFCMLEEYDADDENKRTPLDHVLAVLELMNRTDRLPEGDDRHFWLEVRFWLHALHDLKKTYGSRSPLHTKLGRDMAGTFFWQQNAFAKASTQAVLFSDELIETVTFLIEWHHLFMYLNSYLPEDFMVRYKQQPPKNSQELNVFVLGYGAERGEPLEFDFSLL